MSNITNEIMNGEDAETLRRVGFAYPRLIAAAREIVSCLPELYGDHVVDGMITVTIPVEAVEAMVLALDKSRVRELNYLAEDKSNG